MKASEVRDLSWDELRGRLGGAREAVWTAMRQAGRPLTTAQVAELTGISLWTVRPRVCELVAWGFAECVGRSGRDGLYRALSLQDAFARWTEGTRERQLELHLAQ